jgi:hypothetical protein
MTSGKVPMLAPNLTGEDVRFAPRPHPTSPSFPGLEERLEAGARMDDELFPLLWSAA